MRELQIQVAGWASDAGDPSYRYLAITGVYDGATAAAVRRFQQGYALAPQSGIVDDATRSALERLLQPDGSTLHFSWQEMLRNDPDHLVTPAIRENTRRIMFKLEALRRKLGDVEIIIKAGYQHGAAQQYETAIGDNQLHADGAAVDITAFGATRNQWYRNAMTCGFTGLGPIDRHWQHCDTRMEQSSTTGPWYANGAG